MTSLADTSIELTDTSLGGGSAGDDNDDQLAVVSGVHDGTQQMVTGYDTASAFQQQVRHSLTATSLTGGGVLHSHIYSTAVLPTVCV